MLLKIAHTFFVHFCKKCTKNVCAMDVPHFFVKKMLIKIVFSHINKFMYHTHYTVV